MENNNKKKAAIAAVLYFLRTEEEYAQQMGEQVTESVSISTQDLWSYSGRQTQMVMRNMIAMKAFPGFKK